MKKYILLFIVLSAAAVIYLSFPLKAEDHFVSIKDKRFFLDGKEYYPVTLNYMVSIQSNGEEFWPCAYTGYNAGFKNLYTTKDSCLLQLKADMDLIREMGFNAVRLVGVGEEYVDKRTGALSFGAAVGKDGSAQLQLSDKANYDKYFHVLDELFKIAGDAGLKVIFLTRMSAEIHSTDYHLMQLARRFKDEPAILAYDFFNEPLYFDSLEHSKEEVYNTVKKWSKIVKMYAPNQLSTIGLAGVREVFEWDPNILDVDFLSFHPYEYEPEMVRNEMYWYGTYLKKPWMLGETAVPADNDSVSYMEQNKFAHKTLNQAYNCGAIGYSWWQYKDVEWYSFHANFMGVVTLNGKTVTANKGVVNGTVKPLADEFRKYRPGAEKDSCRCMSNYYNYSKFTTSRIAGRLVNADNEPLQGGLVLAWNQWWSKSYTTYTKPDGSFEVLADFPFYHWMASATEYSMVRGDVLPDTAKTYGDGVPTMNIGTLKVEKLPFVN